MYFPSGKLEYCFAREKKSIPMCINLFVEMTVFLCLICFFIYDKIQGFLDEIGLFIIFFAFYAEIQNGHQMWHENNFWEKSSILWKSLYLAPFLR